MKVEGNARDNLPADADRFADRVCEFCGGRFYDLAMDFVGVAAIVF